VTRVALVTGASGGIGRATAVALARDGLAIACAYGESDVAAKETVALVRETGAQAEAFGADVADERQVKELVGAVREWAEAPLVLVACAGISRDGLAVRYAASEFERTLAVNLTGAFLCARASLPAMLRARWGRIVAVSSVAALRGNPGQVAYGASKSGLIGLTRTLAREYGGRGITANVVAPGLIDTDMTSGLGDEAREGLRSLVPSGHAGTPEQVAAAIRFLASDAASYVNGAVLTVDGGLTA
jgi:3-oxoacyl-[acyl-carrier protein] reductase